MQGISPVLEGHEEGDGVEVEEVPEPGFDDQPVFE